jgi:hypothetical protein
MTYTVTRTDGTTLATVLDGTINTNASPLVLVGKNYAGYGLFLNENVVHLTENFANTSEPNAPMIGQLWFNKSNNTLNMYDGTRFKRINGATSSTSAPPGPIVGDFWYDTNSTQLNVWSGSAWILIGPLFSPATGRSGAIPEILTDTGNVTHVVTNLYVEGNIVGVVSRSQQFTSVTPIPGFGSNIVRPGLNLADTSAVPNIAFQGAATNSQRLNNLTETDFLRSTVVAGGITSTVNQLGVNNANGVFVGSTLANASIRVYADGEAGNAFVENNASNKNINFRANLGGTPTTVFTVDGTTGIATFADRLSVSSITKTGGNGVGNIGSVGNTFNRVFATSTDSLAVNGLTDAAFLRATAVGGGITSTVNQLGVNNANGVFIGSASTSAARVYTDAIAGNAFVENTSLDKNINFRVNRGGTGNTVFTINGASATADFLDRITLSSITKTGANTVGNIGQTNNRFGTIFGTSTTATYADLAEYYESDAAYEPGTVVVFGGSKEVTQSTVAGDARVAGVISTDPAFVMNCQLESDNRALVALTGRVPTKVKGPVAKGDMMISSTDGYARACATPTIGTVIGKSLENFNGETGIIEVVVGRM